MEDACLIHQLFLKKETGNIKEYVFYHCTHNKKKADCKQRSIEERELKKALKAEMASYTILPQFKDWAIEMLNKYNDSEVKQRSKIQEMQSKAVLTTQNEIDNLTQMRFRDLINDEEYVRQKKKLQAKHAKLKEDLGDTERRAVNWLELTERTFDFITYAAENFKREDYKELEMEYLSLEPAERVAESGKSPALDAIRLKWRRD